MRCLLLFIPLAFSFAQAQSGGAADPHLVKEVRHELVMLPYLDVFDNLEFRVEGNNVVLFGQVTRPELKSEAEKVVKRVEGVGQVTDNIEVLPLSTFDDQIRRAEYAALARNPQLQMYFMQALAPINIIVKNGHVTLNGVVRNKADSDLAAVTANGVPGIFSLTNNLKVEK